MKKYTIKACVMDDELIKSGGSILTRQYFEEHLQRIREIARAHAESEVEKYRLVQDRLFESNVDRLLKYLEQMDRSNDSQE